MMVKFKYVFLLIPLFLVSCGTLKQGSSSVKELSREEQRKYDYFFLEALRLKDTNQFTAAFNLFEHCLSINPNAPTALYEIGEFYIYLGEYAKAESALLRTVELDSDNYWYHEALADFYQSRNEQDKAANVYKKMLYRFPEKQAPIVFLLDYYNQSNDYSKLITLLDLFEQRVGKDPNVSLNKVRVYLKMNNRKKAISEIQKLIEEYPYEWSYRVILGDIFFRQKKYQEAYEIYQEVLAQAPHNDQVVLAIFNYYKELKMSAEFQQFFKHFIADKEANPILKTDILKDIINSSDSFFSSLRTEMPKLVNEVTQLHPDNAQVMIFYASYLITKKENEKALKVLADVIKIAPEQRNIRMMLIEDAFEKEKNEFIVQLCLDGLQVEPADVMLYYYLSIAYSQLEEYSKVVDTAKNGLQHVDKRISNEVISNFYTLMGDAYYEQKMMPETYAAYDSALKYNASNIAVLNNYAYYLSLNEEQLDKAEEMSYKTVKLDPLNANNLDTYAWILFQKGNYVEALIYIEQALKNDKNNSAVLLEHCGDIYFMNGDVDKALEYWQKALDAGSESKTLQRKINNKRYIKE